MRIFLDTNILARAASGPPSPAADLLNRAVRSPHLLCTSPFLILELSRVMRYERIRRIHGMADEAIDQFLQDLQSASLVVEVASESAVQVVPSDPDDDPIVAAAIAAGVEVLCTLDRHIRTQAVIEHCARHGIEVLTDLELLQRLRGTDE